MRGTLALDRDELGSDVKRKRILLLAAVGVLVGVLAFGSFQGAKAWWAWRGIERVAFDTSEARGRLAAVPEAGGDSMLGPAGESAEFYAATQTFDLASYNTVLAIGSDERPTEQADVHPGVYADAVLFWLVPVDGSRPALVSLPRDLLVVDPCTGEETKLDRTLAGCGSEVSGPERVALAVEDYTGIGVDHFAMFGFEAFVEVVDSLGGVEICVEHPARYGTTELPDGCSVVDGRNALMWMRSRKTQEFVDGEWQFVEGVSDASRAERQQALMFAMLSRIKQMRSPASLSGLAESVGDAVVLDETLSMGEALAMAWELRSLSASAVRRIVIPTEPVVTADGSFALRATAPFRDLLEG